MPNTSDDLKNDSSNIYDFTNKVDITALNDSLKALKELDFFEQKDFFIQKQSDNHPVAVEIVHLKQEHWPPFEDDLDEDTIAQIASCQINCMDEILRAQAKDQNTLVFDEGLWFDLTERDYADFCDMLHGNFKGDMDNHKIDFYENYFKTVRAAFPHGFELTDILTSEQRKVIALIGASKFLFCMGKLPKVCKVYRDRNAYDKVFDNIKNMDDARQNMDIVLEGRELELAHCVKDTARQEAARKGLEKIKVLIQYGAAHKLYHLENYTRNFHILASIDAVSPRPVIAQDNALNETKINYFEPAPEKELTSPISIEKIKFAHDLLQYLEMRLKEDAKVSETKHNHLQNPNFIEAKGIGVKNQFRLFAKKTFGVSLQSKLETIYLLLCDLGFTHQMLQKLGGNLPYVKTMLDKIPNDLHDYSRTHIGAARDKRLGEVLTKHKNVLPQNFVDAETHATQSCIVS